MMLSMNYSDKMRIISFLWPLSLVVVATSIIGIFIFALPYSLLIYDGSHTMFPLNYLIPWLGEGTEGVIIIVSIFFAIYLNSRFFITKIIFFKETHSENNTEEFKWKKFFVFIEVLTALSTISAAFSIMGFIINDHSLIYTIPEISSDFILLGFLAPLPFLIFVSRKLIFLQK